MGEVGVLHLARTGMRDGGSMARGEKFARTSPEAGSRAQNLVGKTWEIEKEKASSPKGFARKETAR